MGTNLSLVPALDGEVVHRYGPLTDRYWITGRDHRPVTCLSPDSTCSPDQNTSNLENDYVTSGTDNKELAKRLAVMHHIDSQERWESVADGRITLSQSLTISSTG